MTRFENLELPCRTRATANPSWRFRVIVSMRSEPVLSRASLYDRGLYPMRSLRRKPIIRKSSLWWAVRRLLKSWERIVHVAHPYSIASITSALNSLILSDRRIPSVVQLGAVFSDTRLSGADTTLNLDVKVRALADSTTKVHKLGRLFIPLPCRLNSQRVRRCVEMGPQVHGLGIFF